MILKSHTITLARGIVWCTVMCLPLLPPSMVIAQSSRSTTVRTTRPPSPHAIANQRQRELSELQRSIERDRAKIATLSERESATMQSIIQLRKHSQQIQRYMTLLNEEIAQYEQRAAATHQYYRAADKELADVKQRYSKLVREALRKRMLRSSSTSTRQRSGHVDDIILRRITESIRFKIHTLSSTRDSLGTTAEQSLQHAEKRTTLLRLKDEEQRELEKTVQLTRRSLARIRSDRTQVQAHLKKSEQSAAHISKLIAGMVATDRQSPRRSSGPRTATSARTAVSDLATNGLKSKSLPYPVASRTILRPYGPYSNPVTNTQSVNPGIDIAIPQGSLVSSIAAGTVSLTSWLPGYGSVVIIDHHNGFRSVYANLSSIVVRKNQKVTSQQNIGRSSESIDGEFVHLEIWEDKQRHNPLNYLK